MLLQNASTIQVEAGFAEPNIVTAWYGDDWSRTAYAPVGGLAEFEQLASAQGTTPFDLLASMLAT